MKLNKTKKFKIVVFNKPVKENYAHTNNFNTATNYMKEALRDNPGKRVVME